MKERRRHVVEQKSEIPRLIVIVFGLAGLVAFITLITLLLPKLQQLIKNESLPNENRTWLQAGWTQEDRTLEEVTALTQILHDNQIKTVYVQTNRWHGQTGEYIVLPFTQNFLQRLRNTAPTLKVYAWLIVEPEHLINPADQQKVTDFADQAIHELGFDGIHLQAKSVPDNSEDFITLLRALRVAIGPGIPLSITVPPDRTPLDPDVPPSPLGNNNLTWNPEYKRRVLLNVNEIALMAHASGLTNPDEYESWLAYQVAAYAQLIEELEIEMIYVIALPTYPAELAHDPAVENPETAIEGILRGQDRARSAGDQVDGVALYPWEETQLPELEVYWQDWVQRGD